MPRWRGYRLFGQPTPNDVVSGNRLVRGWYVANDGGLALPYGAVTLSEASLDPDFSTWGDYGGVSATWTSGQADPFGGSSGWTLREEHGVSGIHGRYTFAANRVADTHAIFTLYWQGEGDRWLWVQDADDGSPEAKVDPVDGSVTAVLGSIVSGSSVAVGSWWKTIIHTTTHSLRYGVISGTSSSHTLTGDSSKGLNLYLPDVTQPRASAVADESLLPTGTTKRGADLVSPNPPGQPLFHAPFADSPNGNPVIFSEPGRTCELDTAHADPAAVFDGVYPNYAVTGVVRTNGFYITEAYGGAQFDVPLRRIVSNVYTYRSDGAVNDSAMFSGSGNGTLFDDLAAFEVISIGTTRHLYVNGAYRGSATLAGTAASITCAKWAVCRGAGENQQMASNTVYADPTGLGTHEDVHSAIWPPLRAEALAFGVTV